MNEGKKFEEQFKASLIKDNFLVIRLPDPPQSFNMGDNSLRFANKNPYDLVVYKNPNLYCLELKSNKSKSISIQFDKQEKGKDIKLHQIDGLTKASQNKGVRSGFILNYRSTNNTYYLDIKDFNEFLRTSSKKSINENDVSKNGVLIPQTQIRVKYYYDFKRVVELKKEDKYAT